MTEYNVIAEVDASPTMKRVDQWMDALSAYHPAVSRADGNRAEFIITIDAPSLEVAASSGLAIMLRAAGPAALEAFRVITTARFDEETDAVGEPELIGVTEAAEILGVTRQRVLQLVSEQKLRSARIGGQVVLTKAQVEQRRDAAAKRG